MNKQKAESREKVKKIGGILGIKLGMTRIFDEEGNVVPVTAVLAGPCRVIQIKTKENDGYSSVQLGIGEKKKANKPLSGHLKKWGVEKVPRYIREIKVDEDLKKEEIGDEIRVEDVFEKGENVKVSGISKGKGFQGGVKRWGFAGGPKTHGQSDRWRAPGSIGASSFPSRVWKGQKMAGRMGNERVTVRNLKIVDIIKEDNVMLLKGAVPGPKGGLLIIERV
ncbi:MAG: 50S ribosomal protein L3 [Caldiserica bacterium]|nr:MAG: 50S ribosomal protein L3 [Caldisericota bacterium]